MSVSIRAGLGCAGLLAASAFGQASFPAVFVTNNGNLRGSATSYRVNSDGTVSFVQEFIIGERLSSQPSIPGTNAYSGSLTPNGKYLAVSHATSASVVEQITVLRVDDGAHLSLATTFQTPDSPLDLAWIDDETLAVTQTKTSGNNFIHVYHFNEETLAFTLLDSEFSGSFTSWLALSPDRRWLFGTDSPLSGGGAILAFEIEGVGVGRHLTYRSTGFTAGYALGPCVNADSTRMYSCGGASGAARVSAFTFDAAGGVLNPLAGTPFFVSGSSPKQAIVSPDGRHLLVVYGTDGTVRSFFINTDDGGALSETGQLFDVGGQGSAGNIAAMRAYGMDLLFVTDKETFDNTPRGLCSLVIGADGTLTPRSQRVDSGGISPNDVIAWAGPQLICCTSDYDGDGDFGTDADIEAFFACIAGSCCPTCWALGADINADGDSATDADIEAFFRIMAGQAC